MKSNVLVWGKKEKKKAGLWSQLDKLWNGDAAARPTSRESCVLTCFITKLWLYLFKNVSDWKEVMNIFEIYKNISLLYNIYTYIYFKIYKKHYLYLLLIYVHTEMIRALDQLKNF